MLNAKFIGVGAAGNKAVIQLLEQGVIQSSSCLLLNSTLTDVPEKYKEFAIEFGDVKGCGKERNLAKEMIVDALSNHTVNLDAFLDPEDKMVVIVTSSEGGTGCGASSVIAQYMKEVINTNVQMFVFTGFEDDVRGLKNTVDWFHDLSEEYVVQAISNKSFLDESKGNRKKAENLANQEFVKRVSTLLGQNIIASDNNIDDTDLYKIDTTPGFMTIEHCILNKIRSVEDFNMALENMMRETHSLDNERSAKRIGIIINCGEKTQEFIDQSFEVIKAKYGEPYELFLHIQNYHDDEYVDIIVSGMKIPFDDVKTTYNKYKKQLESIDMKSDRFFKQNFDTSDADALDMNSKVKVYAEKNTNKLAASRSDFFSKMGVKGKGEAKPSKTSDEL